MKISLTDKPVKNQSVDFIVIPYFENTKQLTGYAKDIDELLNDSISKLISDKEIEGKVSETITLYTFGVIKPKKVLILGLGSLENFDSETARTAFGKLASKVLTTNKTNSAVICLDSKTISKLPKTLTKNQLVQAVVEGLILGSYQFTKYKSDPNENKTDVYIQFKSHEKEQVNNAISVGNIVSNAVNLCRDLANEPSNIMTPSKLADIAKQISLKTNIGYKALEQKEMKELGMGALLGVAKGSKQEPKLIVLEYKGNPEDPNKLALVGKGITFDSGGISIKPATNMGDMKGDMAGGASVISTISAIALLRPCINILGIVPATENMPGGNAQKPGDIVTTMSGKTIEIDNTDAEGRLVLADAITYAKSLGANQIIDVATLTGAITIALGNICAGVFSNNKDLTHEVIGASNTSGEKMWELPMFKEYAKQYKSKVADIKNVGGRGAGSITGAQIIGEFAAETPWVHLDIAGTSRTTDPNGYQSYGATGIPVRTLIQLILNKSTVL